MSWRCTIRDKPITPRPPPGEKQKFTYPGRVSQNGDTFSILTTYKWEGMVNLEQHVSINAEAKTEGLKNKWMLAKSVVDLLMLKFHSENA